MCARARLYSCDAVLGIGGEKLSDILAVLYEVRSTLGLEKNRRSLDERKRTALEKQIKEVTHPPFVPVLLPIPRIIHSLFHSLTDKHAFCVCVCVCVFVCITA